MKISCLVASLFLCLFGYSQNDSTQKIISQKVSEAIQKYFENPTFDDAPIDKRVLKSLKDSGITINDIKQGQWKEYSIDSSLYGLKQEVKATHGSVEHTSKTLILNKNIGTYVNGKKEGLWTTYESFDNKEPLFWQISLTCNYLNGLKDSVEIIYQDLGKYPAAIGTYKKGKLNGEYKSYFFNYPFGINKIYQYTNDEGLLKEQFYKNGNIEYIYRDTLLNGIHHIFYKHFDDSNNIKESGYVINDTTFDGEVITYFRNGKIESIINYDSGHANGEVKYFFNNGQLWSTVIYKKGLVWAIKENFNKMGEKMNGGTLKDGNGYLILYNEEGQRREIEYFKDGIYIPTSDTR